MTDMTKMIEKGILNRMVNDTAELHMKADNAVLFVHRNSDGTFHLYYGCDLVIGDTSLENVARIIENGDYVPRAGYVPVEPVKDNRPAVTDEEKQLYDDIKLIYSKQTDQEKASEETREHNNVGFNAYDAKFMTSIYKSLEKYGRLTVKQIAASTKVMKKYSGQLARLRAE